MPEQAHVYSTSSTIVVHTAAPQTIYVTGDNYDADYLGRVGPQGPPGPVGDPGTTPSYVGNYIHRQDVASDTWVINHNLGFRPGLAGLEDDTGHEIEADFGHLDAFTCVIRFGAPMSGVAYLNG